MRHLRLRVWSGAERPLGFRRTARLRAWMQWALNEIRETRVAVDCIRRALEGDAFWTVEDDFARPYVVVRPHRNAYLPARFRARNKIA